LRGFAIPMINGESEICVYGEGGRSDEGATVIRNFA